MLPYSSYQSWNQSMQLFYALINKYMGDEVKLVCVWRSVQMCVYHMEFEYLQNDFKVVVCM